MLEQKLLYTVRHAAEFVLNSLGVVVPFAAHIELVGEDVRTYFPRDANPEADFGQLLDLATDHLSGVATTSEVGAIAVATTLESEGKTAIAIQIESRSGAFFVLHPYRKNLFGKWKIGAPQITSSLLVERFFGGAV